MQSNSDKLSTQKSDESQIETVEFSTITHVDMIPIVLHFSFFIGAVISILRIGSCMDLITCESELPF